MNENIRSDVRIYVLPMVISLFFFVVFQKSNISILPTMESRALVSIMIYLHFQTRRLIEEKIEEIKKHE